MLSHEWDEDADGTADERETWTYDEAGNPLTYERDGGHLGDREFGYADGTVDYRESWTYYEECGAAPDVVHDAGKRVVRDTPPLIAGSSSTLRIWLWW